MVGFTTVLLFLLPQNKKTPKDRLVRQLGVEGTGLVLRGDGTGSHPTELPERCRPEATPRLGDGALARHLDRARFPGEPLQDSDEGPENHAGGEGHEEVEGDHVVGERIGGKAPNPLALKTHPREDPPNPLARIDSGRKTDAQMHGDRTSGAHAHRAACHDTGTSRTMLGEKTIRWTVLGLGDFTLAQPPWSGIGPARFPHSG